MIHAASAEQALGIVHGTGRHIERTSRLIEHWLEHPKRMYSRPSTGLFCDSERVDSFLFRDTSAVLRIAS